MYVRITQMKVPAGKLDTVTETFKQRVIPSASKQPGYVGAVLAADRETGIVSGGTYWDTVQSMNAAEEMGIQVRTTAAEASGSEIIDVDRFEITVAHRPAGAATTAFMRVNQFAADPAKLEDGIAFVRDKVVPNVSSQPGFRSLVMGVNRMTGRGLVVTNWDSKEARDRSEPAVTDQREQAGKIFGGPVKVTLAEMLHAELKLPAGV